MQLSKITQWGVSVLAVLLLLFTFTVATARPASAATRHFIFDNLNSWLCHKLCCCNPKDALTKVGIIGHGIGSGCRNQFMQLRQGYNLLQTQVSVMPSAADQIETQRIDGL